MAYLFKRGSVFHLKYYLAGRQMEISLRTEVYQIAREKQRQFESAQAAGSDNPFPTRTPLPVILGRYIDHLRAHKTAKSAQTEIYYLREAFGPICPQLLITSRRPSVQARKRKPKLSALDARRKLPVIAANVLEEITAAQIGQFIDFKVRDQGLSPKTANHYRSILRRLFNWAIQEQGIRLPSGMTKNPAAQVRPYREPAPVIRFLTLPQIDEQLHALRFKPQLQTMVAVLIYAGLRREELLWLTADDLDLSRKNGGNGLLRIRAKTIQTASGAGEFWQPKTKVNRAVPISRALRAYLDRYTPPASRPVAADQSAAAPLSTDTSPIPDVHFRGWLFPSPHGARWDVDNFSADLRQANADAGLPWSCLDYRHTFGSQLAQAGVSLYKIASLMGNSPEICRRHYASLQPEGMFMDVEFVKIPLPLMASH